MKFSVDGQIQDASFFCDVKIPLDLVTEPRPNVGYAIRISNFGGLASITFYEEYRKSIRAIIKIILTKRNFVFIHPDDLEEVYDGSFEKFKEILRESKPNWWIRVLRLFVINE